MRLSPAPLSLPFYFGGRRPVGATRVTTEQVTPVLGTRNMKLVRYGGGKYGGTKAKTILFLVVPNADLVTPYELRPLYTIMRSMVTDAVSMSQGGLSYADLRRMGHPYGHGLRRGLGRMKGQTKGVAAHAIVNKHRGIFAASWRFEVNRRKDGIELVLKNVSNVAGFLAFGTKKMKAHYPGNTAMAKKITPIRSNQRGLINKTRARENALNQIMTVRRAALASGN